MRCACSEGGSRVSARQPTYFPLSRQRKVSKAKATLLPASLRCASGNLRCSSVGCAAKLAALLRRSAQTAAASQLTKRVRLAAHTPPHRLRASAQVEGNGGAPVARLLNDIWLKRRCSKRCKLFSWKRFSLLCPLSRLREWAGVREELLSFPRWGKGGWGHCAFVWALCLW